MVKRDDNYVHGRVQKPPMQSYPICQEAVAEVPAGLRDREWKQHFAGSSSLFFS